MGYDLAIPGNHEFDFGLEILDNCAEQLNCGYVCANFCTSDGTPVFDPWRIIEEIPTSVKMDETKQFICVDGERRISDVKIGDEDLDPNGLYTITTTEFLLTGGSGYTMFEDAEILTDTMLYDNEVITKYIFFLQRIC